MLVDSLKLNNYRNYKSNSFKFEKGLNIIIGKNGVGKTNILESLVVVSNTKSFRTLNDNDLIRKGTDYAKIDLLCDNNHLKVVISNNGKRLYINDIPIKKTSEFIGKLNCILFKPSDLNLFTDMPRDRRRLMDLEIGKVSKEYLNALSCYNILLKDKNKLLKEEKINMDYLDIIDTKMLEEMKIILTHRNEFFEVINESINDIFNNLLGTNHKLNVKYLACSNLNDLENMMKKSRERDLFNHYATFGTHHDDYEFYYDYSLIKTIASQGQCRAAVISFKLALEKYIRKKTKELPIILLDDILSELDNDNKLRLLRNIPYDNQVVITGTDLNNIKIGNKINLIKLEGGQ